MRASLCAGLAVASCASFSSSSVVAEGRRHSLLAGLIATDRTLIGPSKLVTNVQNFRPSESHLLHEVTPKTHTKRILKQNPHIKVEPAHGEELVHVVSL